MSDEEKKCPEKWNQTQLLAYIEGDMDNSARWELETHLKNCEICASELESLQKMDILLKHNSDVFHPDEQQLYQYVTGDEDPDGKIALHLKGCESCREDVALLREIIDARSEASTEIPAIPQSLLRKIGQLHPAAAPQGKLKSLYLTASEFISAPLRMPSLALGTAAAVIVLVIISVPLWQSYHKAPRPDSGPAIQESPAQKPGEAVSHEVDRSRQNLDKDNSIESLKKSRAERDDRNGVPSSPAPAMRYAPERKLEKLQDGEQGHITPTPETEPAQIPPSVRTKEKSRSPAAGIAVRPEKESPSPRASKPQMPASPMKKQGATQQHATVDRMRPAAQAPSASVSDPRIPVHIQVVDSDGKSIPGLRFQFPANLWSRYRFEEDTAKETADLILIRVIKRDGSFDLSADLFKTGSAGASRTLQASGVGEPDLQNKIASLISSLLERD
ncbi:MAG: anti-sigma factor family protein [Desulfomonilaceae bacterium]